MNIRKKTWRDIEEEKYQEVFSEIEDRLRREYESEFGSDFRLKHPFNPDRAAIHAEVVKNMHTTTMVRNGH